jgi:hypothetical protein
MIAMIDMIAWSVAVLVIYSTKEQRLLSLLS